MQNYSTIIGVIELRQDGIGYRTIRRRYEIGSSVITLIMERFSDLGITLDELRTMNPKDVESKFYPEENRRDTRKSVSASSRHAPTHKCAVKCSHHSSM